MTMASSIKKCFVPNCKNSSETHSQKEYIFVPRDLKTRKLWYSAVGLTLPINIPDDFHNWHIYKNMGGRLLRNKNVIPHKFIRLQKNKDNICISKDTVDLAMTSTSPELLPRFPLKEMQPYEVFGLTGSSLSSPSTSDNQESVGSQTSFDSNENKEDVQKGIRQISLIKLIESNPEEYLGIPKSLYNIINSASINSNVEYLDVLIVLTKIKLHDSDQRISFDFGVSKSYVQKTLVNSIGKLATFFNHFIFWPSLFDVQKLLPIPFRAKYAKVRSIIDCFEVEIENPSNPVHQVSTWSEYKNCNTAKFLISCTPCGFINYISVAYPGIITDKQIVEKSGYLNNITPGDLIMAGRGFKHINILIEQKGGTLIIPPGVNESADSSVEEVKMSKQIASLRIHIEKIIGRVRQFQMLQPHSCVDHNKVYLLSYIAIIACGIINLQEPIL